MWLKGADGMLEIVAGIALLTINPLMILRATLSLTQDGIAEDPRDFVAGYLRRAAAHLSLSGEHFMAVYLLAHGAIKLILIAGLLREKLPVYPVSMVVFVGFIAYQVYRFSFTHSLGLIALSIFDLAIICLIYLEYRFLRARLRDAKDSPY